MPATVRLPSSRQADRTVWRVVAPTVSCQIRRPTLGEESADLVSYTEVKQSAGSGRSSVRLFPLHLSNLLTFELGVFVVHES